MMAREFELVPKDSQLNSYLQQADFMNLNPYQKSAIHLDGQMRAILENNNLSDSLKAKQYMSTLSEYLLNREKASTRSISEKNPNNNIDTPPIPTNKTEDDSDERKLTNYIMGKTQKIRAQQILSHLKPHKGNLFDYGPSGNELIISGKPIKTNITDILNNLVNSNFSKSSPPGTAEFLNLLKETHVPELLIKNPLRRKQLQLGYKFDVPRTHRKRISSIDRSDNISKYSLNKLHPVILSPSTSNENINLGARKKRKTKVIAYKENINRSVPYKKTRRALRTINSKSKLKWV